MNWRVPNATHSNASGSYQAWSSDGVLAVLRDGGQWEGWRGGRRVEEFFPRGQVQNFLWEGKHHYRLDGPILRRSDGHQTLLDESLGVWLAGTALYCRAYREIDGRGVCTALYDISTSTLWKIHEPANNFHQVLRWDHGYVISPATAEQQHLSFRVLHDGRGWQNIEGEHQRISHPAVSGDKMIYVIASGDLDGCVALLDLETLDETILWDANNFAGRYHHAQLVGDWVVMSVLNTAAGGSHIVVGNIKSGLLWDDLCFVEHPMGWATIPKPSMRIIDGVAHVAYQDGQGVGVFEFTILEEWDTSPDSLAVAIEGLRESTETTAEHAATVLRLLEDV